MTFSFLELRFWGPKANGSSSDRLTSLVSEAFDIITIISGPPNSYSICLQAPQGEQRVSSLTWMAVIIMSVCPSKTALEIAHFSAQKVREYDEFSILAPIII